MNDIFASGGLSDTPFKLKDDERGIKYMDVLYVFNKQCTKIAYRVENNVVGELTTEDKKFLKKKLIKY